MVPQETAGEIRCRQHRRPHPESKGEGPHLTATPTLSWTQEVKEKGKNTYERILAHPFIQEMAVSFAHSSSLEKASSVEDRILMSLSLPPLILSPSHRVGYQPK